MVTPALFARYPDAGRAGRAPRRPTSRSIIRSTGFFRAKTKSLIGCARALVERARRRGAARAWTRWSSCPASAARRPTSCSATPTTSPRASRSTRTCCASRTGSASRRATTRSRSSGSSWRSSRASAGRAPPTCSSSTAARSATRAGRCCGQCPVFALCRWPQRQAYAMGAPPRQEARRPRRTGARVRCWPPRCR